MSAPRSFSILLVALLAFAGGTYLLAPGRDVHSDPADIQPARSAHSGHHHAGAGPTMSDAEMKQATAEYWRDHVRVPAAPHAVRGVDATFTVSSNVFDADGDFETMEDTVRITPGQTVRWQWLNGFHTVTSGAGPDDPEAGLVFNQPSDSNNDEFQFTFTEPETVRFHCDPHFFFGMTGVIIVQEGVGVEPVAPRAMIGFTAAPWPNPSAAGASFRFALAAPSRVRSDVVDVQGRHVAALADRDYGAGDHVLTWNGRTAQGPAPAGVYYLRLRAPGFVGARPVTIRP